MDTHICPKCSQECIYKNGIMCTIQGCVKDGTAKNNQSINDIFNMFNCSTNSPFSNMFYGKSK